MSDLYEALLLVDQQLRDNLGWHVHPEIVDIQGWWPDGSPAWAPDPDRGEEGRRHLVGIIEKRQPADDDWLEDHPAVGFLVSTAVALNEVLYPRRGTVLGDLTEAGTPQQQADAMAAHVRAQVGPDRVGDVFRLAREIIDRRAVEAGGRE